MTPLGSKLSLTRLRSRRYLRMVVGCFGAADVLLEERSESAATTSGKQSRRIAVTNDDGTVGFAMDLG